MIPAPILFGALIDRACLFWQQPQPCSDRKGACFMYDNFAMGSYLLALVFSCKGLSLAFFFVALFRYKPPPPAPHPGVATDTPPPPAAGLSAETVGSAAVQSGSGKVDVRLIGDDGLKSCDVTGSCDTTVNDTRTLTSPPT